MRASQHLQTARSKYESIRPGIVRIKVCRSLLVSEARRYRNANSLATWLDHVSSQPSSDVIGMPSCKGGCQNQICANTSRISRLSNFTPGMGGSGYEAAASAKSLDSKTMTDIPTPSIGSSQYAQMMPGARDTIGSRALESIERASWTFSTLTVETMAYI